MPEPSDESRVNKLRYRAWRRGFIEADLILGPFTDTHAPRFDAAELDELERLLDELDHDLYGWIIGQLPTPAAFDGPVMALLKASLPTVHAARRV
jgi:antitoxin CptB